MSACCCCCSCCCLNEFLFEFQFKRTRRMVLDSSLGLGSELLSVVLVSISGSPKGRTISGFVTAIHIYIYIYIGVYIIIIFGFILLCRATIVRAA